MLRIVRYLSKAEIGQMLVALVSIVGQIWLDLTLPDYMADITQLVETPGSEMHDIWVAGGKMLLVSLGSAACAVVTGFIAARVGASFSQVGRRGGSPRGSPRGGGRLVQPAPAFA